MSGGQIGTAVGFVAGFFLPGGPQVWAGIGGMVGGLVDPEVIQGPKIGEITQQTAAEGGPRPIVFGRSQPITGNIIADSEPRVVKSSSGKGQPEVQSESAYRTYAVGVCEGPITAFLQVWRNGTLVYDAEDPEMDADNAEFLKYARFYLGTFDQMPSPDLEAIKGVGNVHGHRGTCYMVLADEDVTEQRGMWSQWQFRVLNLEGAQAQAGPYFTASSSQLTGVIQRTYDFDSWDAVDTGAGAAPFVMRILNNRLFVFSSSGTGIRGRVSSDKGETFSEIQLNPPSSGTPASMSYSEGTGYILFIRSGSNLTYISIDGLNFNGVDTSSDVTGWGNGWAKQGSAANGSVAMVGLQYGAVGATIDGGISWSSLDTPEPLRQGYIINDGETFLVTQRTGSACAAINMPGGSFVASYPHADPLSSAFGNAYGSGYFVVYSNPGGFAYSQSASGPWIIGQDPGWHVDNESWQGAFRFIGDAFYIIDTGGEIYSAKHPSNFTHIGTSPGAAGFHSIDGYPVAVIPDDQKVPLSNVVIKLSERVGLAADRVDVELLDGLFVRGLTITNTYPCTKVLESLSQFFFFMPSNVSGKTRFVPFGEDTVATITEDDLVDNDREIDDDLRRGDTISISPLLHLNYFDVHGGLNTDKQTSERPRNGRATGEQSMQTPVSSDDDEAATVVAKIHAMQVEQQRGELSFSLPDNWLFLTESDPVFIQWENRTVRGVITQVDTQDGYQDYKAIRDRQSIHSMLVEGHPPAPVTRPPSRVVGPTLIEFLDIPILSDSDDRLGYYMAVTGLYPAWRGAQIELSLDGGENYIDSAQVSGETTMGVLTEALGDHPQAYPDEVNSFQVSINTPDAELQATTLAGMMNRQNLAMVGNEMINFADPDEVSEAVWDISYILRGRKGTETEAHAIGERFVMLDNVFFVPADLTLLGKTLTFRATSFGTGTQDATIISATFTGQSQTERQPAYLQAHRSGTDVVASWQGVGRLGGGVNIAMGAYFAGYRLTLTDGTTTQTHDTTEQAITTSLAAFTGPVTVSVQQRNQLTGLGPAIEVIV